jgi:Tol biopolymer transport system component
VTVTAPPRPPRPSDPVDRGELEALVEALIEEARQRARRRRRMYAAVVTLLALLGVAVFTVFERSAQSQTASREPAVPSSLAAGAAKAKIAFVSVGVAGGPGPTFKNKLYVMNPDGSGRQLLAANTTTPAWSADGRRIVFVDGRGFRVDIYVMKADGSGLRNLTRTPARDFDPVWSPDGRKIAFLRERDAGRWPPNFQNFEVYVMNADGSGQRRLTGKTAHAPAWSPNGRRIAFVRGRDVYVMNADGSGQRNLTGTTTDDAHSPAWSPDGHTIAFASGHCSRPQPPPARCFDLYAVNADGSGLRRLTRNTNDHAPAWSRDGRKIAFVSVRDGNREIYVMNADGSGQQRLTRNRAGDYSPAWSPDGRKIAFVSQRDGNVNHEIYVMNTLDGGGQRNLTRTPAQEDWFAWTVVPTK